VFSAHPVEKRFPFSDHPTGWFVVGFSEDLAREQVETVRYFGRELVLYRSASGVFRVTDPHCPHLGAHLGAGKVEGETLRCPFHGWQFDGAGRCVRAYGENVPKTGVGTWHAREQNGLLLVWYDGLGRAPGWEPPVLDERGWTPFRFETLDFASHPQETSENSVDLGHFSEVHAFANAWVEKDVETEGPLLKASYGARRVLEVPDRAPAWLKLALSKPGVDAIFHVEVHGLGFSYVQGGVPSLKLRFRHLVLSTPVDDGRVHLRIGTSVERARSRVLTEVMHRVAFGALVHEVSRDVPLWERKRYVERPVLARGDGPIHAYRRWAKQFYPKRLETAA